MAASRCAQVLFKGNGPTGQTRIHSSVVSKKKKKEERGDEERGDTDTAERALFEYLWQVGQSRLQSKMLSVPQPAFSAGLGEDLFHSVTVQNESVL